MNRDHALKTLADRPREWSTDGRTYTRTGIRCVSIGLPHEWMHMGRAGQHDVYVCDACGCWSRVERVAQPSRTPGDETAHYRGGS